MGFFFGHFERHTRILRVQPMHPLTVINANSHSNVVMENILNSRGGVIDERV